MTTIVNKCAELLDCSSPTFKHQFIAPGEAKLVPFPIDKMFYNNYWVYNKEYFINLPHLVIIHTGENGPNPKMTVYDREFLPAYKLDGSDTTEIGTNNTVRVHNMYPNRIIVEQKFASFYLPSGKSVVVPRDKLSVRVDGLVAFYTNGAGPTRFSHYDGKNLSFW